MLSLLIALAISSPAQCKDLLFNLRGEQQLATVGTGGGVTPEAEIVWDSDRDGPLPAGAPLGYAERWEEDGVCKDQFNGDQPCKIPRLRANAALKSAKDARDAARAAKEAQDASDATAFRAMAVKVKAETATAAEVRKALKFILEKLGN